MAQWPCAYGLLVITAPLFTMKKVGIPYPPSNKKLTYAQVPADPDGWVDVKYYYPADYDLMFVKIKGKHGVYSAWWSGTNWDGPKIEDKDVIMYWKRRVMYGNDYG